MSVHIAYILAPGCAIGLLMVQHCDEAAKRAGRQFLKSKQNGASVRSWLEDSWHELYMVVSFSGTWE